MAVIKSLPSNTVQSVRHAISPPSSSPSLTPLKLGGVRIVATAIAGGACFFLGTLTAMHAGLGRHENCSRFVGMEGKPGAGAVLRSAALDEESRIEAIVKLRVAEELEKMASASSGSMAKGVSRNAPSTKRRIFSDRMSNIATGAVRTSKADLQSLLDFGVPVEPKEPGRGDKEALILYGSEGALPSDWELSNASVYVLDGESAPGGGKGGGGIMPIMSAADATANCDALNVIALGNPGHARQCVAIVPNYESYHVQRWLRVQPTRRGEVVPTEPLRHVSRGHSVWGKREFVSPTTKPIRANWIKLQAYLGGFDEAIDSLKPIAERVAIKNTIIVLTCNKGQSELLMNFACNAKAKGFELGNVLLFATDTETEDLAKELGIAAYYDEKNYRSIPSEEAKRYGDQNFVAMMYAKVLCVHLILWMGYDVLFQDVDIVWFKNPLDYYHDEKLSGDFDMYFQDDGVRTVRYAPYSANSGFYYVRNNPRTRYLFTQLLYSGDLIEAWDSHQQVLVQLLSEHSSLFGLRVKVHERSTEEFPGGYHYHRKKPFMKDMINGKVHPYIFHMSWTSNKDNKLKFFQQLGEWYLNDECIGKTVGEILDGKVHHGGMALVEPCCSKEPIVTCHYKDKPSKVPCNDKPPIDKNGKPFWADKNGKPL